MIVQIQINLGVVLGFIKLTINYNSIYDRLIVHIHLGIVLAIHPIIVKIDVYSSLSTFNQSSSKMISRSHGPEKIFSLVYLKFSIFFEEQTVSRKMKCSAPFKIIKSNKCL